MAGNDERRLHPKLRVIKNRSDRVNATGALLSSTLTSTLSVPDAELPEPARAALQACERFASGRAIDDGLPFVRKPPRRPKLEAAGHADHAFVNVLIETLHTDPGSPSIVESVAARIRRLAMPESDSLGSQGAVFVRRNFVSAVVPVNQLSEIASLPGVAFVHSSDSLSFELPRAARSAPTTQPSPRAVTVAGERQTGAGVLIGIIDVGGFDFAHPDFLDDQQQTRFVAIWDQGGRFRAPPKAFTYGSELAKDKLRAAVDGQRAGGLPAVDVERQSQRVAGSHGTHVASIAAGRSGVCPEALIAGVLISVPVTGTDREQRQATFSDSSRIIDAIEYLYGVAADLGMPVAINISLGTNGGAHDGSNGVCRWIDSSLSVPGRAISVAAGNAGQEVAERPDDIGWIMGRIHTNGHVRSLGLDVDIEWIVVGDGIADVSENELEIWYGPQDRFTVSIQPPGSDVWYSVSPREFIENRRLPNGTVLSMYNELYHPTNGDNYVSIYLSPNLLPDTFAPIASGVWRVRLHGDEIRAGHFHAWIERDDPQEVERRVNLRAFRFPSFFSARSNVDSHSIGSLACAHRVVSVANVDSGASRVNVSSSQGPTRDGRSKPDIAAPGTDIVAANGFDDGSQWTPMTGTSMASPYVCGVIGLMLAANPQLTAAQCQGILKRTARPLPTHGYEWRNDAGFGLIDAAEAVAEARVFGDRTERRS